MNGARQLLMPNLMLIFVQRYTIDVAEDASVCQVRHAFCDKFNADVKPGTAMLPCQVRAAGSYHLDHE